MGQIEQAMHFTLGNNEPFLVPLANHGDRHLEQPGQHGGEHAEIVALQQAGALLAPELERYQYAPDLERAWLPDRDDVAEAIRRLAAA